MSIRLRLTVLYSAILALTLFVFGTGLYAIQARSTLSALKQDLSLRSDAFIQSVLRATLYPFDPRLSGDPLFRGLREREIIRVLDAGGALAASPAGIEQSPLPLTDRGLETLRGGKSVWETATQDGVHLLIYNRPVLINNEVVMIIQMAHPLTERDRTLAALSRTLISAGLVTILAAFGIGWLLAGYSLRPIHRITQTAEIIGSESDFTRRVDYTGPNDEVGHLARTFNAMLARLQDAYQRVRHALQMQRGFVADVSHELRTPLTTVRGNLELLRRDPPLPAEEQADILNDLVDESDRLIRLVNELLVLARADSSRSQLKEPVVVAQVIHETVRQVQQLDPRRAILIDAAGGLCALGDRDALKQVLLALLDNAMKYSEGEIRVTAVQAGERLALSVRDAGPGMTPDQLEHIFDRFYRASESRGAPGFGLGLSIARALVEAQGGAIRVESAPGQGTTVRVELEACGMLSS